MPAAKNLSHDKVCHTVWMTSSLLALQEFFLSADSTQRQKLAALQEAWGEQLTGLSDEELSECLRLIQRKINSKKLVSARDEFVGALRRDGLPAASKIPAPPKPETVEELVIQQSIVRDPKSYSPELEALIAANPRSKDAQLVYRDWLEEQGLVEDGRVKLAALVDHKGVLTEVEYQHGYIPVSYTHLTLPTTHNSCRSRWSPYH